MSNELSLFDQPGFVIPEYVDRITGGRTDLKGKQTRPQLLFDGKVWQYNINGEKQKIVARNSDGDLLPVQIMRVVILGFNEHRNRAYFEGNYDPSRPGGPSCFSEDGVAPHPSVQSPLASTCKGCAMAIKGSKVSPQGTPIAACTESRLLCVVPVNKLDIGPLRLKLPGTSDYDANETMAAQKWFAFKQFKDYAHSRGVRLLSSVVTKIMFDPNVPYPKLKFSAERVLTEAEMSRVNEMLDSPEMQTALNLNRKEPVVLNHRAAVPTLESRPVERAPIQIDIPKTQSKAIDAAAMLVEEEVEEAPAPKKTASKVKQTKKIDTVEPEAMPMVKSPPASPKAAVEEDPSLSAILDDWGE